MTEDIINKTHEDFLKDRSVIINGTIDNRLIEGLVLQIIKWNAIDDEAEDDGGVKGYKREENPIKVYIHSPGGIVFDSLSALSSIVTSKTPIHTYALGHVGSAAFMIFIVGHKRFSQPYSTFMYHDMTGGGIGKTQEREESVIEQKRLMLLYQGIVKKYTKITQKMLDKIHKEKLDQLWLAPEAHKLDIFDGYW